MLDFSEIFVALKSGKSVRQKRWDKGSRMFVLGTKLMFSHGGRDAVEATPDELDWKDMNRKDWEIIG